MDANDLRWKTPFSNNVTASLAAVKQWMAQPPTILSCRDTLVWNHEEL
jgi:hypothetical protein